LKALNLEFDELTKKIKTETDLEIRRYIPDKFAKLGDWRSTEVLGKILLNKKESSIMRNECAESLGKQGDPEAIKYLVEVLDDKDEELRRTAIWSLGQIGKDEVLEYFEKSMNDNYEMSRRWVAKSLARVNNKKALEMLKNFYEITERRHRSKQTETRVINDIIRAVEDHVKFMEENDYNYWNDKCSNLLEDNFSKITHQATLRLVKTIIIKFSKIKESLKNKFISLNNHFLIQSELIEIYHLLQNKEKVRIYLKDKDRRLQLLAERYLIQYTTESALNLSDKDVLIEQLIGMEEALKRGIDFTIDYNKIRETFPQNFEISRQLLRLEVIITQDYNIVLNQLDNKAFLPTALYLLEFFPNEVQTYEILEYYGLHSEKKIRQIVVRVLYKIMSSYIEFRENTRSIAKKIAENDRIWHIRRDARKLLETKTSI
jgi:hypothetical protein